VNHEPNITEPDGDARKGAAAYTPLTLAFYDLAVLQFSNSFVWQCGGVAWAFDRADITNIVGAPSSAQFAKGGNHGRIRDVFVQKDKACVGGIAARPCKKRKDGAPSARMVQTEIKSKGRATSLSDACALTRSR